MKIKLTILSMVLLLLCSCNQDININIDTDEEQSHVVTIEESNVVSNEESKVYKVDEIPYEKISKEVVTNNRLKLRSGPSLDYDALDVSYDIDEKEHSLGYLLLGTELLVTGRTVNQYAIDSEETHYWYQVNYNNQSGWVYGKYVSDFDEALKEDYSHVMNHDYLKFKNYDLYNDLGMAVQLDLVDVIQVKEDVDLITFGEVTFGEPAKELILYLVEHKNDQYYLLSAFDQVPEDCVSIEMLKPIKSSDSLLSIERNNYPIQGFQVYDLSHNSFDLVIQEMASGYIGKDLLVDTDNDQLLDTYQTSRDNQGTYQTTIQQSVDLGTYFNTNKQYLIRDYINKTLHMIDGDDKAKDDILALLQEMKENSYSKRMLAPLIHPALLDCDMTLLSFMCNHDSLCSLYLEDQQLGEFEFKDNKLAIADIVWLCERETELPSEIMNYLEPREITIDDFEITGYNSYYTYFIEDQSRPIKLSVGDDELIIYGSSMLFFVSLNGNIKFVEYRDGNYGQPYISLADFDGDGQYTNLIFQDDVIEGLTGNYIIDDDLSLDYFFSKIIYVNKNKVYIWSEQATLEDQTSEDVVKRAKAYYDVNTREMIANESFIGSKLIWKDDIKCVVHKEMSTIPKDIFEKEEWLESEHLEEIAGYLYTGDTYKVLAFDHHILQIQLEDGTKGWIGSFHSYLN